MESCDVLFVKQKTAYEMRISDWSSDVCSSDLVARHEGERGLEKIEPPQRRKLVQHHQQLVLAAFLGVAFEPFGQASTDLVQHQPDQRLGTADVGWWTDEIERYRGDRKGVV